MKFLFHIKLFFKATLLTALGLFVVALLASRSPVGGTWVGLAYMAMLVALIWILCATIYTTWLFTHNWVRLTDNKAAWWHTLLFFVTLLGWLYIAGTSFGMLLYLVLF